MTRREDPAPLGLVAPWSLAVAGLALLLSVTPRPVLADRGDSMAVDERVIWPHEIALPSSDEARRAIEAQSLEIDRVESAHAAQLGWDTFQEYWAGGDLGVTGWTMIHESPLGEAIGAAVADTGLILSIAQVYLDSSKPELPDGVGIGFLKDFGLWAAGRFGWSSLAFWAGLIGAGDYLLQKVGEGGVEAKQLPARVAFENYFGAGRLHLQHGAVRSACPPTGYLTEDEWMALLWSEEVRTVAQAERVLRGHFAKFWDLDPDEMEACTVPERVRHEAGFWARVLLGATGGMRFTALRSGDRRAIEDDFIRKSMLPRVRTYFTEVLPRRLETEARDAAARRMAAVRDALNSTCVIRLELSGVPGDAERLEALIGKWRYRLDPSADQQPLFFTRYAWLAQQPDEAPLVRVAWRAADGRQEVKALALSHPLERGGCRQSLAVEFGSNEEPEEAPRPSKSPPRQASAAETCAQSCPAGAAGADCRELCECKAGCNQQVGGLVGAGVRHVYDMCISGCENPRPWESRAPEAGAPSPARGARAPAEGGGGAPTPEACRTQCMNNFGSDSSAGYYRCFQLCLRGNM